MIYYYIYPQRIVERFQRNRKVAADEDVAERMFLISEDRIQLTFHHQDGKITASVREFIKPPNANDKGAILTYSPDMTSTFQVDPHKKPAKNLQLYNTLVDLVCQEEKSVHSVRDAEEEVRKIPFPNTHPNPNPHHSQSAFQLHT